MDGSKNGIYIYCVIATDKKISFGPIGIGRGGREVRTLPYRGIAAVISSSPPPLPDPGDKEALIGHLALHQSVVEKVMQNHTVLPIKFGTTLDSLEDVEIVLRKVHAEFKNALDQINNKIELDVVALWNGDQIFKDIATEDKEIQRLREEIASKSSEESHEDKIRLGKMVESALTRRGEKYVEDVLKTLGPWVDSFRLHRIATDKMVMNAAFLMDRRAERKFDFEIRELNERFRERINFRCVGPLPPYSFHTMEIGRIEFATVDEARKTLGLDGEVTLSTIKEAYRKLAFKYHPDQNNGSLAAQGQFQKISQAYQLLTDYCQHYRYSFREEDVRNFVVVKVLELPDRDEEPGV